MNLEEPVELLKKGFISENGVLKFQFIFSDLVNGKVVVNDKLLGIDISANWEINLRKNDKYIFLKGFDGLRNKQFGYEGTITDVIGKLKSLKSLYDLAGE